MLAQARAAVRGADPAVVETWKWRGAPVGETDGVLVVGGAGLDGGKWRAVDLHEGDPVRVAELQAMVRAAAALRRDRQAAKAAARSRSAGARTA